MKPLPILVRALRDPGLVPSLTLAEWDVLLRQSTSTNLTPTLLALIESHGFWAQVPAPVQAHFDWVRALASRHRRAVHFEVDRIQAALRSTGLPLLLLKGAAYTMAGLRAGEGRLFSDVDILVPKARLNDVEAELMLHGWATTTQDPYDQRYYRQWMHELPPMTHMQRGNSIDVHHAILPETAPVRPDPEKLRACAVPVDGMPAVAVLAPHDMVLHSAVHLFFDGEFDKGLRDLFDFHRLLGEFRTRPGFWDGLAPRAHALELGRPLFYALRHSQRMFGTEVPPAVLGEVAPYGPNPVLSKVMDWLFVRALQPLHPSCDTRSSKIAHFMLYVRGNWLRMPPLLLTRHLFHKAFVASDQRNKVVA